MTLIDLLDNAATRVVAHGYPGRELLPYSDTNRKANALAHYLFDRGVRSGDRILILLPNSPELVIACFASWKLRAIAVPVDSAVKSDTLTDLLGDAEPAVALVGGKAMQHLPLLTCRHVVVQTEEGSRCHSVGRLSAAFAHDCRSPLPVGRADENEVVSLTYTSGSTGRPKAVMHTHASWLAGAAFTARHVGLSTKDRIIIPLPLSHAYSMRQVLAYMLAGADVFIVADLLQGLQTLTHHRVTALLLVPTACNMILDQFQDYLSRSSAYIRYIEIGSGALAPERLRQLRQILPRASIYLPYGLTEARVGFLSEGAGGSLNRLTAVAPGLEIAVMDASGTRMAYGRGEIALRGSGLMKAYWRRGSAFTEDGWFRTGDCGELTVDGDILVLGRTDSVVKVAGHKVQPSVVEDVLSHHPSVAEAVVLPVVNPGSTLDCELHAYVVVRRGCETTPAALLWHCRQYLESYKVPAQIHFRTSLPRSPIGKLQRGAIPN
jgi:acyl-coenzyme A synthetase/AMP-(fatty) acid ligase